MSTQTLTQPNYHQTHDNIIPENVIIKETNCLRCGRKLTNPKSVMAGIGPKCARKVAYEIRRIRETPAYISTTRTQLYLDKQDTISVRGLNQDPLNIIIMPDKPDTIVTGSSIHPTLSRFIYHNQSGQKRKRVSSEP